MKTPTDTRQLNKPRENTKSIGKVDIPFLILVLALLSIGLIMLASASYASNFEKYGDSYHDIKRQLIFAVAGIAIMFATAFFDYHRFRKYAFPLLCVAIFLLVLVLIPIPGLSVKVNGARRWLNFGIRFQPSEIGKLALIIYISYYISANYNQMNKFKVGVLPLFIRLCIVVALVAVETHLSAAIIIMLTGIVMIFVGGAPMRYFAIPAAIGGVGGGILIWKFSYMFGRISTWLDPFADPKGAGWQIVQSLYAIGSGGLLGLGLGQSRQKHLYIPEAGNDYIFSITCEELGFVGAVMIILLFAMIIWRGFTIAFHARDKFGSMLVIGIISRLAIQTVLNIGVVTNLLPSTGITLPFFSYGGTALVILLFEMGIVLSVSRFSYLDR